jgi:hypothetical protein
MAKITIKRKYNSNFLLSIKVDGVEIGEADFCRRSPTNITSWFHFHGDKAPTHTGELWYKDFIERLRYLTGLRAKGRVT